MLSLQVVTILPITKVMIWYYELNNDDGMREATDFKNRLRKSYQIDFAQYQILEAIHRIAMFKSIEECFDRTHDNHFKDVDEIIKIIDALSIKASDPAQTLLSKLNNFISQFCILTKIGTSTFGLDRIGLGFYLNDLLYVDGGGTVSSTNGKYLKAGEGKHFTTKVHPYFKIYIAISHAVFFTALSYLRNPENDEQDLPLIRAADIHRLTSDRINYYHKDLQAIGSNLINEFAAHHVKNRIKDNGIKKGQTIAERFGLILKDDFHLLNEELFDLIA